MCALLNYVLNTFKTVALFIFWFIVVVIITPQGWEDAVGYYGAMAVFGYFLITKLVLPIVQLFVAPSDAKTADQNNPTTPHLPD